MSKTILTEITGWTPVIDSIVTKHGLITAAVFGKIWRYCQGEKGVCTASQNRVADELKVSRKTINEHCKILVDDGYLSVKVNDGGTNIYYDTGKAGLKLTISAPSPDPEPVPESYTPKDDTCNPELQGVLPKVTTPVTQSYTKKVLKKAVKTVISSSNSDSNFQKVLKLYETYIGPIAGAFVGEQIDEALKEHPFEWFEAAFRIAVANNVRTWAYVKGILKNWKDHGFMADNRPVKSQGRGTSPRSGNGHRPGGLAPGAAAPGEMTAGDVMLAQENEWRKTQNLPPLTKAEYKAQLQAVQDAKL